MRHSPSSRKDRSRSRRKPDPNFLPETVSAAFQAELDQLIAGLATSGGFKEKYLMDSYKEKYRDPLGSTTSADRRSRAITKWLATECRNASTNCRLQLGDDDFGWVTSDDLIEKIRSYVTEVLGELSYPEILHQGGHTNGASTRVRRGPTAGVLKHAGKAHVTEAALKHWFRFASTTRLSEQVLEVAEGSVLFTVPKATDIDRVACKEPEVNMFLQRSVGNHIRRRLRRFGIDLNDQTVNQRLARVAYADGLATIDLSSASDSISAQLVYELLPFDWWNLLDDLRSHSVDIDGERHELEMFSSMGNGFTFELESLIFWAMLRAIQYFSGLKGRLSVYGDDLIVSAKLARRVARVFHWFGFKVNAKKSFWTGPFRESCGKHYYRGRDVTPFYLREPVSRKTDMIRLLNRLLVWDSDGLFQNFLTEEVALFHKKWSGVIPLSVHGGLDPEDPTSLVTGDPPRRRIAPKLRQIKFPEDEGLTFWLTTRRLLGELPLSLTPRKEGRFTIVPQPTWAGRTTWDPYALYGSSQCEPTP